MSEIFLALHCTYYRTSAQGCRAEHDTEEDTGLPAQSSLQHNHGGGSRPSATVARINYCFSSSTPIGDAHPHSNRCNRTMGVEIRKAGGCFPSLPAGTLFFQAVSLFSVQNFLSFLAHIRPGLQLGDERGCSDKWIGPGCHQPHLGSEDGGGQCLQALLHVFNIPHGLLCPYAPNLPSRVLLHYVSNLL